MAKKAPVGTVRQWASGPVIKAHDNSSLKDAWISLPSNSQVYAVGRKLDMLGSAIVRYKIPLQGEKYLDREIEEFRANPHKLNQKGPYHPNDFKQYIGFYGNTSYSFTSEFNRRAMAKRIGLENAMLEELEHANTEFQRATGNYNQNISAEKIKEIKKAVKLEYVYDGPEFKIEEAYALGEVVQKVYNDVKKGLDFEGDEKRAYTIAKNLVDRLPLDYEKLSKKKASYNKALKLVDTIFHDNWAVNESFKDYAKSKYKEYLKKYRDQIKEDSIEDQKKIFGVTHETPRKEFYDTLEKKVEADPSLDYFDLLELRYATQLDIDLQGDWEKNTLDALKMFEEVADELPDGHIRLNSQFDALRSSEFSGGSHGGYAFYEPTHKRITLSDKLLAKSSVIGRITEPDEFRSTLVHEIGHSVSQKLGRDDDLSYKRFVVEAGWSYQQEDLQAGTHATGDDRRIPRQGRNQNIPLISDYSNVSQEEAFAEYFSFYHNNKHYIDEFLETGDSKYLKKDKVYSAGARKDPVAVRSLTNFIMNRDRFDKVSTHIERHISDRGAKVTVTAESPFHVKISMAEQKNLDKSVVRARKDLSMNRMPPVIAMQTAKGETVVIDGANRVLQAKLNHHLLPTINVSQELVQKLVKENFTIKDISDYAIFTTLDEKVPALRGQTVPKTIEGLKYGREFVPFETLHKNTKILRAMQTIYSSDALKKAFYELNILL